MKRLHFLENKNMVVLILCVCVMFGSCTPKKKKTEEGLISHFFSTLLGDDDEVSQEDSRKVVCIACRGTGIYECMPGDIMAPRGKCAACEGTGFCLPEMNKEYIRIRDFFSGPNVITPHGRTSNESECYDCYGRGTCPGCAGRGEIRYEGMYGQPDGIMDCSRCKGTGRCSTCRGKGRIIL